MIYQQYDWCRCYDLIAGFHSIEFLLWTWWPYSWKWHLQIHNFSSRVFHTQMFAIFFCYNITLLQHIFTFSENLKHSMWVLHLENNSQRHISSWFIFWLDINTIPQKHALDFVALQNAPPGAVLVGSITYGTVSTFNKTDGQKQHDPVSYHISYIIPPSKVSNSKSSCHLSIFYHRCCYDDSVGKVGYV